MIIGVREPIPGMVYPPVERLRRYVEAGELALSTLPEAIIESCAKNAARVAIATEAGDVTYAELDDITDRFASALSRLGLATHDRVLFQAANSLELAYAVVGVLKAGLIPVCTQPAHREQEIGYIGCHVNARVHIVQGDDPKFDLEAFALRVRPHIPTIRHVVSIRGEPREGVLRFEDLIATERQPLAHERVRAVPRDPFQAGVFQLSGGTTGVPKVIPRTQNDYLLNATRTIEWLGFRADDVMFMPMPMIHNAAMVCFFLPSLLVGSTYCIPSDMTAAAWGRLFRAKRPTFIGLIRALLPRFDEMIERGHADIASVRKCWAPDCSHVVREKYGLMGYAMFGMGEGMCMNTHETDPEEARDWTVGRPMSPCDEVRLLESGGEREAAPGEPGEFSCRGPTTIAGYFNAPERNAEAFTADGFYKSGDVMVRREIAGKIYYAFAGRIKDVVNRGAEKINCEEVESGVSTHPAVVACAAVAMPDPVMGERLCAYLVLHAGASAPTVVELGRHLEGFGMAKFKWPERIEVTPALPLTKVGKLDKSALRADIQAKLQAR